MKSTTTANTWNFAPNSVTVNGQTFPASYSLARGGDVYVFTALRAAADAPEMPVRVHISADMPMHAEAVAAAQAAKDKPSAQDKPAPAKRSHKSKGIRRPDVPALPVQDKPSAPAKKPAPCRTSPPLRPRTSPGSAPRSRARAGISPLTSRRAALAYCSRPSPRTPKRQPLRTPVFTGRPS